MLDDAVGDLEVGRPGDEYAPTVWGHIALDHVLHQERGGAHKHEYASAWSVRTIAVDMVAQDRGRTPIDPHPATVGLRVVSGDDVVAEGQGGSLQPHSSPGCSAGDCETGEAGGCRNVVDEHHGDSGVSVNGRYVCPRPDQLKVLVVPHDELVVGSCRHLNRVSVRSSSDRRLNRPIVEGGRPGGTNGDGSRECARGCQHKKYADEDGLKWHSGAVLRGLHCCLSYCERHGVIVLPGTWFCYRRSPLRGKTCRRGRYSRCQLSRTAAVISMRSSTVSAGAAETSRVLPPLYF